MNEEMNKEVEDTVTAYLSNVETLYQSIKEWVIGKALKTQEEKFTINEQASGEYEAQKLTILDEDGDKVAELVPIGAWIIGAKGRIDLTGRFDKAIIIDLEDGGPTITTRVGKKGESRTRPLYKGVDPAGWYWIEDNRLARVHPLDQELFFDLLAEVSDREF